MLNNIARKYKHTLAVAAAIAGIAAYVIPFDSGSVIQTQATSSNEHLNDQLDRDQARTSQRLHEVIDANPDQTDRVNDRQALSDERYDFARQRGADQVPPNKSS